MISEYKIEKNLPWVLVLRDPSKQLIIPRRTKVKLLLDSFGNSERPVAIMQAEGLYFTLHEDHAISWAHVTGRLKSHLTLQFRII